MKKIAFMLISLYMGLMGANAQSNKFDLNEDGHVNITDVTKLVTNILDQNNINGYDLNDDGDVNITDVILFVNYILGNNDNTFCPDGNHPHAIDLGLPSGTKWACSNVGATKPEEYGGYYAWGETEEKDVYSVDLYEYYQNGRYVNLGSDISGTDYDVAHVKWGGKWCMPTLDDIKELLDNCMSDWTMVSGVHGRKFTSKINGNSIFVPAAGSRWYGDLLDAGEYGSYWSSTQDPGYSNHAYSLYFTSGYAFWDSYYRIDGRCVRPVVRN